MVEQTVTSEVSSFQANGHRVMTISPRYDQYKDAWDTEVTIEVIIIYLQTQVDFLFFGIMITHSS